MSTVNSLTPVVSVTDNRGLTVRTLNWNRSSAADPARGLVTHTLLDDTTRIAQQRDPRRFTAWQSNSSERANLINTPSLSGQTLRRDSTDSGWQVTLYDAEGRPAWMTDARGTTDRVAYDVISRPVARYRQPAGGEEQTSARYIYGDNDTQTATPQANNLRGICVRRYDEGGLLGTDSVALSGAVLEQHMQLPLSSEGAPDWNTADEDSWLALLESDTRTTTVTASATGMLLTQTDACGHTLGWQYDVSGSICRQTLTLSGGSEQTLLESFSYSAAGQPLEEVAGNGVTTTYSYEPQTQRLSNIAALRSSDNVTLQALGYAYDPVGNITAVSDGTVSQQYFRNQATAGSRVFSYDALYQLVSASGRENAGNTASQGNALPALISPVPTDSSQYVNYTRNYSYDDSGNLQTLTHTGAGNWTQTMVTDTQSNRSLRQNSDSSLTPADISSGNWFDARGNLLTLQTSASTSDTMVWNSDNHLQTVVLVSRSSTDISQNDREVYQYRDGIRVRKQTRTLVNSDSGLWNVEEVVYLPALELRRKWQESGTTRNAPTEELHAVTTQAGRASIRLLHWKTGVPSGISNDQPRYSVDDNIGSLSLELDRHAEIISREEYYPFGGTAVWAARSQVEADYKTLRYSGKERDSTGLYYYGYRYYAPWLCRWTASDPAGEVDGLNLFRIVRNNPISLFDPDGRTPYPRIQLPGSHLYRPKLSTEEDRNIAGASFVTPSPAEHADVKGIPIRLENALTERAIQTTPLLTDLLNPTKVDMDNATKEILANEERIGNILAFNIIHYSISENYDIHALRIVDKKTSVHQMGRGVTLAYWAPQGGYVDIPAHPQNGQPKLVFTPGFSGCSFVADKLDEYTIRVRHVQGGKEDIEYNDLAENEHGLGMIDAMEYRHYGYHTNEQGNLMENITGSAFMIYENNTWHIKYQSLANAPGISSLTEEPVGFFKKQPMLTSAVRYNKRGTVVNTGVISLR
ncbi:TPA: RHS repeat protein [Salmonella enterica subsp. enterica serovar Saintpaul str. CFSAN004144]|nr:RHS repeat protein [Salmonella enterica subsp. enterica serovar Saintpaul str. CFSAN004144]